MQRSVFAIELCVRLDRAPQLLPMLRSVIVEQGAAVGLQKKWAAYRRACETLLGHIGFVERGCWDYFDDHDRATRDFTMWLEGMTTEEGARRMPSGPPDPYRGEPRYLTFTMALSIARPSQTDTGMKRLCEIPEHALWRRDVFSRILGGMGLVNFAHIASDVMYLIPRDDDWGLTVDDLAQAKFHYLRPLVG